jgi:hypothetical protein
LLLPSLGFGQFVGDTVIVYVDNRAEVKVAISDYSDTKSTDEVLKALKEFEALISAVKDQLSPDKAEIVRVSDDHSLTIEPGDPKIIYLEKDGEMRNTGFRDRAVIEKTGFEVTITTTDISSIPEFPLSNCFEKVIAKFPEKIRWSKTLSYECINGEITELGSKNNEVDMLGFLFGAGGGLIKGQWVADISFGISLGLNHKGMTRGPYVSSNMIFDFDAENKMHINTFLNVGYKWNLDKKAEKPNMFGIDVGYLIVKQGDLFGENTFKLSFNWSPAKYIEVSPQLYVTNNFKQAFPGIRVGFGF